MSLLLATIFCMYASCSGDLIFRNSIPYRHEESEKKRLRIEHEYRLRDEHVLVEDSPLLEQNVSFPDAPSS